MSWRTIAHWLAIAALACLVLVAVVRGVVALFGGWSETLKWASDHEKLAAWVQAVFSVVAILASVLLVQWQHHRSDREAAKQESRAATDVVLMLHYVSAQLKQTILLADFQLNEKGNPQFFRDVGGEFQSLAFTLSRLSLSAITLHGHLDSYLVLRRTADELVQMYDGAPRQGDIVFIKKHRNRLTELRSTCADLQLTLAEHLKGLDPALYALRRDDLLR